jgi:cation diffusion facilitator CzcD-associated flavoprotein CzcO
MIIGAGLSGLGTAAQLLEAGIRDIVILERNATIGAPPRRSLPGAPCDVPSMAYPYAFGDHSRWPRWSGGRPTAAEVGNYARRLARRFALDGLVRFDQEVTRLEYDEPGARWVARTGTGGRFAARSVVVALGPVPLARTPDVRGVERFAGTTIHTADWDENVDVAGKRVAVIGSGASAVQLIPELVARAARVKVFQRSPRWLLPWPEHASAAWDRALLRTVPYGVAAARYAVLCTHEPWAVNSLVRPAVLTAIERIAAGHLRRQVRDPWERRLLTPTYRAGGRPTLVSDDYYLSLQRDNCKLVHWPIATVSEAGIRTSDALEHQVDVMVLATGCDVAGAGSRFPIFGRGGRTLARESTDRSGFYKGVTVSGFPNMFFIPGPGPRPERSPAVLYMTAQIDYTVRALAEIASGAVRSLEVREDVQRTHERAIRQRLSSSVWQASDVRGGRHVTESGLDSTIYPGLAVQYTAQMSRLRFSDYTVERTINGRGASRDLNRKV